MSCLSLIMCEIGRNMTDKESEEMYHAITLAHSSYELQVAKLIALSPLAKYCADLPFFIEAMKKEQEALITLTNNKETVQ